MVGVVRLKRFVFDLRPEHILLVVVAADGKGGHGDRIERVLDGARGPDAVVGGVLEEALPGGQEPGAGFLHILRKGAALKEVIEADRKSTRLNSSHLGISYAVF